MSTEFFGRPSHEPAGGNMASSLVVALAAGATPLPAEHDSEAWHPDVPKAASKYSSTSFSAEVVEELEKNNPGVLAWLTSTVGVLFQISLISLYVLIATLGALLNSFALKPDPPPEFLPMPSSLIVMNSGLSILIGLFVSLGTAVVSERAHPWGLGIRRISIRKVLSTSFQCQAIIKFSLCAALFSMAAVFSMLAYSKLDAGLKKILDQIRLPLTAVLSSLIIGKKYTAHECMALGIMLLAVVSFYYADLDHAERTEIHRKCRYPGHCFIEPSFDMCAMRIDGPVISGAMVRDRHKHGNTTLDISTFPVKSSKTEFSGLIFSFVATLCNCLGSVVSELLLKGSGSTPFPQQKVQMETTGFPVAIAMSFLVPLYIDSKGGRAIWWATNEAKGSGAGFFQGYNKLTWAAISIDIMMAWMGGLIVKQFSSLVKIIAKCFVLLLTVLSTGTFLKACHADPLPLTMYCLAFIIVFATILFGTMPKALLASVTPLCAAPLQPAELAITSQPESGVDMPVFDSTSNFPGPASGGYARQP